MGQNFHKIEAVRLEGGDLTAFFPFFLLLPLDKVTHLNFEDNTVHIIITDIDEKHNYLETQL